MSKKWHVEVYDQMIKCSIKKVQNPKDKRFNFAKIIRLKNQIIFYRSCVICANFRITLLLVIPFN
ncbi:hypothetical protein BpHYR1_015821 [Brachionus plicatilis]|uniref:Uncharacterized protein n=1 Tax=Brachionus plicatilis TaxID=10195 RepID=A0A3M7SNL6_BRAPC|nr:hypothetical protein BpHYR1_015821 [Brachionus plicatilis]